MSQSRTEHLPPAELALPPQQVEALNNVDLHLSFGSHGVPNTDPQHGVFMSHAVDGDYAGAGAVAQELAWERGDRLAIEAAGHESPWDTRWFFMELGEYFRSSAYATPTEKEWLWQAPGEIPVALTCQAPPELGPLLQKSRDLQLTSPIHYATGIAVQNQVPVHYADATRQELTARSNSYKEYPFIPAHYRAIPFDLADMVRPSRERHFRDAQTVRRLGEVAAKITSAKRQERPTLAYLGGAAHQDNVQTLLAQQGVDFRTSVFSPEVKERHRTNNLRAWGAIATFGIVDHPYKHHQKIWEDNLRAQLAKPEYRHLDTVGQH